MYIDPTLSMSESEYPKSGAVSNLVSPAPQEVSGTHKEKVIKVNERTVSKKEDHSSSQEVLKTHKEMAVEMNKENEAKQESEAKINLSNETTLKKKKTTPQKPKPITIAGTMLSDIDRDVLVQLTDNLPGARLVKRGNASSASVLVSGRSARSVKVICAVARGTNVVQRQWLYDSMEQGKWLPVDSYIDPIAKEGLRIRHNRKKGVFSNLGLIYVEKGTRPPPTEVEEILRCGDGRIMADRTKAEVIIGGEGKQGESVLRLKEAYVIEAAMCGSPLDIKDYKIKYVEDQEQECESEEY